MKIKMLVLEIQLRGSKFKEVFRMLASIMGPKYGNWSKMDS